MDTRIENILGGIGLAISLIASILIVASFYDPRYDIVSYLMGSCVILAFLLFAFFLLSLFINSKVVRVIFYNKDQRVEFPWSVDDYANQVPLWILVQSAIYSVMIPSSGKMPKVFKDWKRFSDRIVKSNDRITEILTNESVVDVVYRKYAPEQRSEMIDVVKNTLRDETRVIRDIRKDSERYHKEFLTAKKKRQKENTQRVNRETNQKVSQNASEFLQNYYMNEK